MTSCEEHETSVLSLTGALERGWTAAAFCSFSPVNLTNLESDFWSRGLVSTLCSRAGQRRSSLLRLQRAQRCGRTLRAVLSGAACLAELPATLGERQAPVQHGSPNSEAGVRAGLLYS